MTKHKWCYDLFGTNAMWLGSWKENVNARERVKPHLATGNNELFDDIWLLATQNSYGRYGFNTDINVIHHLSYHQDFIVKKREPAYSNCYMS